MTEITGQQVDEALENGVSQVEDGAGRFPQVSGLKIVVDLKQPAGSRVMSVTVDGKPLDPRPPTRSPPTTTCCTAATATPRSAAARC